MNGLVALVGAGGLGSPALLALARHRELRFRLIDSDRVELSNLQRQLLHRTSDIGAPKVDSARRIANPERVERVAQRLTRGNAESLLAGAELVLDGSDNFETRFLVNDVCVALGIPYVFCGVLRYQLQVLSVRPGQSACYRCLFVEPPPAELAERCSDVGVLGALVGVAAGLQVAEAERMLRGETPRYADRLLILDAASGRQRTVAIRRRRDCEACGSGRRCDR